jgi:hypothetical protein
MFKDKLKSFVKRLLYGSAWEIIEREVYMPICPDTVDDIPESECINVYGKPKGINCGETFGELYAQIKVLRQDSDELTARFEDLKQASEEMKIEFGNLKLKLSSSAFEAKK